MEYHEKRWYQKLDIANGVMAIISCVLWGALWALKPTMLYVPPNDSNSAFPQDKHNELPTAIMGAVIAASAVIVFILGVLLHRFFPKHFHGFHGWTFLWVILAAEGMSGFCVSIFKNYVGRARPDLYAVCGKDVQLNDPSSCPNLTKSEYYDEFRSWPSGHSQTAMSGFMVLALFVQRIVRARNLIGTFCAALIVCLGIWCGATRIIDYKHHTDDVLAGFFVGFIFAYLIWHQMEGNLFYKPEEEPEDAESGTVVKDDNYQV